MKKTTSISNLKARLSAYLDLVRQGEEILVTDRGRPIARLSPLTGEPAAEGRRDMLLRAGRMTPPRTPLPKNFLRRPRPLNGVALARLAYLGFFGALGSVMAETLLVALRREHKMHDLAQVTAASRAELSAVVESAPSIIIRADSDGKILFINRVTEGLSHADVVGSSLFDFVDGQSRETIASALATVVATGHGLSYEVRATLPSGDAIFQSQMGAVMKGDQVVGVVIITADVTQQVQQRELAQKLVEKDQEMRTLQGRDEFRSSLLNSVAHELNTPLTPLKLQLRILAKRHGKDAGFAMLERNIDRLAALVSDLLDVARVEATGAPDAWATHDLQELVSETAETFRLIAAENSVTIAAESTDQALVQGDQLRITQILYNLVSNAVKYSPSGGTVRLSTRADEHQIVLAVSDDGPGFSAAEMQRLFQPFEQIHATPKGYTGTGLGLYLTKTIVGQHGGDIFVESPGPGKGSTFRVTFPRTAN